MTIGVAITTKQFRVKRISPLVFVRFFWYCVTSWFILMAMTRTWLGLYFFKGVEISERYFQFCPIFRKDIKSVSINLFYICLFRCISRWLKTKSKTPNFFLLIFVVVLMLMQHFRFVKWWIRGFVFWCHEQVRYCTWLLQSYFNHSTKIRCFKIDLSKFCTPSQ